MKNWVKDLVEVFKNDRIHLMSTVVGWLLLGNILSLFSNIYNHVIFSSLGHAIKFQWAWLYGLEPKYAIAISLIYLVALGAIYFYMIAFAIELSKKLASYLGKFYENADAVDLYYLSKN